MHPTSLSRRLIAEGLGTTFLLAAIVGSGIMAERLSGGNVGIALLCNSLATGAMLVVLISIFGPVSGAHLNPAVTLAFLLRKSITKRAAAAYVACRPRNWQPMAEGPWPRVGDTQEKNGAYGSEDGPPPRRGNDPSATQRPMASPKKRARS